MAVAIIAPSGDGHRIGTDLTKEELAAIGQVTVLWAELEHRLLDATLALAEVLGKEVPELAYGLNFKKRLGAMRDLVKECPDTAPAKARTLNTLNHIGSLETSRNRITHGLWNWGRQNPRAQLVHSYRNPFGFHDHFSFQRLIRLSHRVGEMAFRLSYPNGYDDWAQEQAQGASQSGGVVSRSFALALLGIDLEGHRPSGTNPPTEI